MHRLQGYRHSNDWGISADLLAFLSPELPAFAETLLVTLRSLIFGKFSLAGPPFNAVLGVACSSSIISGRESLGGCDFLNFLKFLTESMDLAPFCLFFRRRESEKETIVLEGPK